MDRLSNFYPPHEVPGMIWLEVVRRDREQETAGNNLSHNEMDRELQEELLPVSITFPRSISTNQFLQLLNMRLQIPNHGIVCKLRRKDGTLIPLSPRTPDNTRENPYILEICSLHQNVLCMPRTPLSNSYLLTVRNKIRSIEKRIEHLEKVLPEMEGRRDVRFKEEVSALSAKLGFLTRRLDEAEKFEWKGTIQRMQTLSLAKYQLVVCVQLLMLILDFVVNLFAEHLGYRNVHFLIMYIIQDATLVFSLITIFLTFANTYVFQSGLMKYLIWAYLAPIVITASYLVLSITYHVWSLQIRWDDTEVYAWTPGLVALFVIQRSFSVLYYYFYKRTALRIADPVYYSPALWRERRQQ